MLMSAKDAEKEAETEAARKEKAGKDAEKEEHTGEAIAISEESPAKNRNRQVKADDKQKRVVASMKDMLDASLDMNALDVRLRRKIPAIFTSARRDKWGAKRVADEVERLFKN